MPTRCHHAAEHTRPPDPANAAGRRNERESRWVRACTADPATLPQVVAGVGDDRRDQAAGRDGQPSDASAAGDRRPRPAPSAAPRQSQMTGAERERRDRPRTTPARAPRNRISSPMPAERADRHDLGDARAARTAAARRSSAAARAWPGPRRRRARALQPPLDERGASAPRRRRPARSQWRRGGPDARPRTATRRPRSPARLRRPRRAAARRDEASCIRTPWWNRSAA